MRYSLRKFHLTLRQFGLLYGLALLLAGLSYISLAGGLAWLSGLFALAVPAAFRILAFYNLLNRSGLFRFQRPYRPPPGNTSTIDTRYVSMELDHDTGDMDGVVNEGSFRSKRLSTLSLTELESLLSECLGDSDSVSILEAFIDREYPDWRESAEANTRIEPNGTMTDQEALDILGLKKAASKQDIIDAHRRLIQKVHPDRGGSTYLSVKLNQAKAHLLGKNK